MEGEQRRGAESVSSIIHTYMHACMHMHTDTHVHTCIHLRIHVTHLTLLTTSLYTCSIESAITDVSSELVCLLSAGTPD